MEQIFIPKTNMERRRQDIVATFSKEYLPLIESGEICKSRAYEALATKFYLTRQGINKIIKRAGVAPENNKGKN